MHVNNLLCSSSSWHAVQARVAHSTPTIFVQGYKILTDFKES